MNKNKSGLGDSPLFLNPTKKPVAKKVSTDAHKAVLKPKESENNKNKKRLSVQKGKRSSVRSFNSSSVQSIERSNGQDYRVIKRKTYDFYLDQVYSIEDEVLRRSRQTGLTITKGEIVREIVDFYFSKKKK